MKEVKKNNDYKNIEHKKRILLVVRWPAGGIRTFMRYVYRTFPVESYQFTLIAPKYDETSVLLEDLSGLDLTYCPLSENPTPMEFVRVVTRQLISGSIDLVHSHGFTSGNCVAIPAMLARIPHLLTIHETLNQEQFAGYRGIIKRVVMSSVLSLVDIIQSVSHDAEANLLGFFPKLKGQSLVILNGIDAGQFQNASPRDLRGELGIGEDYFLVGFLGRFMSPKGFIHLVDAVEYLSKLQGLHKKLLVLAFGEGGFIREEKAALKERGLEKFFRFLPFASNVAGVIKGLDLVVMPSLREACPLLPMETLACGIPLIASDCIGLREVVQGTPTLMVPAGNGRALAEGIKTCMEQDQRKQFIDFAPIAARRYNVEKTALAIMQLIREKAN